MRGRGDRAAAASAASDSGVLDVQVALPSDLADGAVVTVELAVSDGYVLTSDELTIGG